MELITFYISQIGEGEVDKPDGQSERQRRIKEETNTLTNIKMRQCVD